MAGRWAERIITPSCGAVTQTLRATPSHRVRSSSAPRSPRSVRFTAASPGSRTERASPRTRGPVDLVIGRLPVALLPLIETSGHARTGGGDRTDLVDAVHGPYGAWLEGQESPRGHLRDLIAQERIIISRPAVLVVVGTMSSAANRRSPLPDSTSREAWSGQSRADRHPHGSH